MDLPLTDDAEEASDYGSDFSIPGEEELLRGSLEPTADLDNPNLDPDLQIKDIEDNEGPKGIKIPIRLLASQQEAPSLNAPEAPESSTKRVRIEENPVQRGVTSKIESEGSRAARESSVSIEAPVDPKPEVPDLRSPLERFRTQPRKAFSVTDLISPSWCELQFWYVLTKQRGRKRRTEAMKGGTVVHKTLEDQVHTTVPVDIRTKEDKWGLRIWNTIQGLRTLRETGMTRELEVWGVIDGLVVNGVIDELSYTCPDPELEESEAQGKNGNNTPAKDQATITDYLPAWGTLEASENGLPKFFGTYDSRKLRKVYVTDVKTRGVKSIPKGASFRPTQFQLMLYRRLLSDLATNEVNADIIFDRHLLKADTSFSDDFIAQIGNLNHGIYGDSQPYETDPISSQDSINDILEHNSLRHLWAFMVKELFHTFPLGSKSVGRVLKAEFRHRVDGQINGVKTFLYEEETLSTYLDEEMRWWRGERPPQGVCVEEAYKCGSCDFANDCSWRKNKIEDHTRQMRERKRSSI